jgi:hypothetical protein
MYPDKHVLFLAEEGPSERALYRAEIPAKAVQLNGWHSRVCSVLYEQEEGTFNGWSPGDRFPAFTPSVIVANTFLSPVGIKRHGEVELGYESQVDIIQQARRKGQKFFFDLSEDYWDVDHPMYQHLDIWLKDVWYSSGLIVSSLALYKKAMTAGASHLHIIHNATEEEIAHGGLAIVGERYLKLWQS